MPFELRHCFCASILAHEHAPFIQNCSSITLATKGAMYGSILLPQCRAIPTHRSSPEQRAKRQPPDQRSPSAENTSGQGRMESIGRGARAKRGMLKKQRNAGERKEVSAAIFGGKSHAYKNVMHDLDMKIRISKHRFICIG